MGLLSNWTAARGLGALWGMWKWKIVAVAVLAVVGYLSTLHVILSVTRADLRAAKSEITLLETVNATAVAASKELEQANAQWAKRAAADAEQLAALKKEADDAQNEADRAQRELASRRKLDRESPDCAALLDRSFAVCPDVGRRLREREAALGPR